MDFYLVMKVGPKAWVTSPQKRGKRLIFFSLKQTRHSHVDGDVHVDVDVYVGIDVDLDADVDARGQRADGARERGHAAAAGGAARGGDRAVSAATLYVDEANLAQKRDRSLIDTLGVL